MMPHYYNPIQTGETQGVGVGGGGGRGRAERFQ